MCVFAELLPPRQGDVCVLSEDGLSSGEDGGQSAHLPQLVFPLLTLQHQAEVRTWSRGCAGVYPHPNLWTRLQKNPFGLLK